MIIEIRGNEVNDNRTSVDVNTCIRAYLIIFISLENYLFFFVTVNLELAYLSILQIESCMDEYESKDDFQLVNWILKYVKTSINKQKLSRRE